jgi:16S rRNA (adenine1518-N6/adenine1519-N6)-dimethyltransferase
MNDAGFLTIVVGLFGTPKVIRHVPPSCFLPPPKVDSSVLHIDCFAKPRADREAIDRILRLVKVGFSQKRKMLRNTIATLPDGPARLLRSNIDPTRRPQTLSIDEWIALAAPL